MDLCRGRTSGKACRRALVGTIGARLRRVSGAGLLLAVALLGTARLVAAGDCPPTPPNPQGPFYLPDAPFVTALDRAEEPGERIEIVGRVSKGPACKPVAGAVLDLWQASAEGYYYNLESAAAPADYLLRGRVRTDAEGRFRVRTVRPGPYRTGPRSWRPAHLHVKVSGPSLLPLTTQVYLPGDPHLARDALVVPSLIGTLSPRPDGPATLHFDFVLLPAREGY